MLGHGGHSASVRWGHVSVRNRPERPSCRLSHPQRVAPTASHTKHRRRARRGRRLASPFAPGSRVSPGAVCVLGGGNAFSAFDGPPRSSTQSSGSTNPFKNAVWPPRLLHLRGEQQTRGRREEVDRG